MWLVAQQNCKMSSELMTFRNPVSKKAWNSSLLPLNWLPANLDCLTATFAKIWLLATSDWLGLRPSQLNRLEICWYQLLLSGVHFHQHVYYEVCTILNTKVKFEEKIIHKLNFLFPLNFSHTFSMITRFKGFVRSIFLSGIRIWLRNHKNIKIWPQTQSM